MLYAFYENILDTVHHLITIKNKAGSEVEILLDKEKPLLNNGYLIKLMIWRGDSYGNSVTPETTGSGHARGKRPWNENQFCAQQKKQHFSHREKCCFWVLSQPHFFFNKPTAVDQSEKEDLPVLEVKHRQ
ncbi:hypothetical protein MKY37_21225 [Psychrobacillus sp. FSL K6-2836]|uniref:hypothetical protein n=1 Tax=Psychrobacillus sp. FSL K6-2836 TaxID=2921548 RepID=UPI0030FC791E